MATLVFTAIGTAVGGPLGGAIGALIGRQADQRIFGAGNREGPRLKELPVTTSSYGQPIPRQFGRMRVAGSVIWATDLVESKTKNSGGKGQPSVTSYSYSASFAVALSSTPIDRIGRIWADGNLLCGAEGDLKIGGKMRIYCGHGDDPVDPLIVADKGAAAPAFRDCAYVVFEDLQLGDFGNRIPALTFEVFADGGDETFSLGQLVPAANQPENVALLAEARGFADEGGPLIGTLAAIDQVFPLICTSGAGGLFMAPSPAAAEAPAVLPEQMSMRGEQGVESRHRQRAELPQRRPVAVRYYDEQRDYQPGVQRALGPRTKGREARLDLPATMNAAGAKQLANTSAQRAQWQHEQITWRISTLDPELVPGRVVRLPDQHGQWLVRSWEWHDRGIDLGLERVSPALGLATGSDAGAANTANDLPIPPTSLVFLETPSDGNSDPAIPQLFAAASASSRGWRGAALFAVSGNNLEPIGSTGSRRALTGILTEPLPPSAGLLLEAAASLDLELTANDLGFEETDIAGMAAGANRLMLGGEIIQFSTAAPTGDGRWRLGGLLRGRAGTEPEARLGHPAGTQAVLLDERLTSLDPSLVTISQESEIAASGIGDTSPVFAKLANAGLSRRPLNPVHPRRKVLADLVWEFSWVRRGRGQWRWNDGVDVALAEETESYLVGYGSEQIPNLTWPRSEATFQVSASERTELLATFGPAWFWVKQIGTYAQSQALPLWFNT